MTETFFPTSAPAGLENLTPSYDELSTENSRLNAQIATVTRNWDSARTQAQDLQRKIDNAAGVIRDYYSENGELTDELTDIARMLDIPLTKEICGTATFSISWTAQVPLDFDPDDLEISFSAECDTYEAEDFDYNEDDTTVEAEDSY